MADLGVEQAKPELPKPSVSVTTTLDKSLLEEFKLIGQREHLKPDEISNLYKEDIEAKRVIVEELKRSLSDESPKNWICVSAFLHDMGGKENLDETVGSDYRNWAASELGKRINTSLTGDESRKYLGKTIVPIRPERRRDEIEIWAFDVGEEDIKRIKEAFRQPVEQKVKLERKDGKKTDELNDFFEASIGIISSKDEVIEPILQEVMKELQAGSHPDSPKLLSRLRRKMLLNRLLWEEEVNGRDLSQSEVAKMQRERIRELLSQDENLELSVRGAKDRVNEEELRRMAIDAVQREKNRRVEAEKEVLKDPLTGLPNDRFLFEELHRMFAEAERMNHGLTALFIDVDDFKKINEHYGHPIGNMVLKTIATILNETLRRGDFLARYGGEEFVALLPESDMITEDQLRSLYNRLNREVAQTAFPNGIKQTISIGIASFPDDKLDNADELLARANDAEREAKRRGKNQFVIWDKSIPRAPDTHRRGV